MIGTMPIWVAVLSSVFYKQHLSRLQKLGMLIVFGGVFTIGGHALIFNREAGEWRGDALFLLAGFLFAVFTVAQRNSGTSPWVATAFVNVLSALIFTPIYLLWMKSGLGDAPLQDLLLQVATQGIAVSILALWLFSEAVRRLGATRAAVIGAMCPALTGLLAFLVLGEIPTVATLLGVVAVMSGVLIVVSNQLP
jgi:drug/metabolite transporter (DMT)-like permease